VGTASDAHMVDFETYLSLNTLRKLRVGGVRCTLSVLVCRRHIALVLLG